MKKAFLVVLTVFSVLWHSTAHSQISIQTGNAQFITDTSAHFQPYVYNNMDTTNPSTVWVKFLSPIADSVSATLVLPRNFSFNFDYYGFICGSMQTYSAGFRNGDTAVYGSTQSVTLLPCTDVQEAVIIADNITIYPIPATATLSIMISSGISGTCTLYDMSGRLVGTASIEAGSGEFCTDNLTKGMYICTITDADGNLIGTKKCILQ